MITQTLLPRLTGSVWPQRAAEFATHDLLTRQEERKENAGGWIEIQGEEIEEEEIWRREIQGEETPICLPRFPGSLRRAYLLDTVAFLAVSEQAEQEPGEPRLAAEGVQGNGVTAARQKTAQDSECRKDTGCTLQHAFQDLGDVRETHSNRYYQREKEGDKYQSPRSWQSRPNVLTPFFGTLKPREGEQRKREREPGKWPRERGPPLSLCGTQCHSYLLAPFPSPSP